MWPCLNEILRKIWSEKIRTIFTLLLFNILVPIGDQVLDLHLIYKCWNHEVEMTTGKPGSNENHGFYPGILVSISE